MDASLAFRYEGKGAHPNYIGAGVIDGFSEVVPAQGLALAMAQSPLIRGSWTWARGGGWQGPYISGGGNAENGAVGGGAAGELWEDLNTFVVSKWVMGQLMTSPVETDAATTATATTATTAAAPPANTEPAVFAQYCVEVLKLEGDAGTAACSVFRGIALASSDAVLKMHYSAPYDAKLQPPTGPGGIPANNWMRDDCLGGDAQLGPVFAGLLKDGGFDAALAEKDAAVALWDEIVVNATSGLEALIPDDAAAGLVTWRQQLATGALYGKILSQIIASGWRAVAIGYRADNGKGVPVDEPALKAALLAYDVGWATFNGFRVSHSHGATLYKDSYQGRAGLGAAVDAMRKRAGK